jgi:hypothetical protein
MAKSVGNEGWCGASHSTGGLTSRRLYAASAVVAPELTAEIDA